MAERVTLMENKTLDTTTLVFTYVQLSYGIPSLILMIGMLILILMGKKYKSSFYKLVKFDLVVNILVYLNTWIAIRLEAHPSCVFILKFIESTVPGLLNILKYLPYFFFHLHFWSAALLTIHRMSSILLPHTYERFWSRWYPLVLLLVCVFSHLPRYLWGDYISNVSITDGALINVIKYGPMIVALNVVAFFSVVYFVLNLANGIITAILASRKIEVVTTSKVNIKRKLTYIAIAYSIAYTAEVVWSVLNAANRFLNFLPDSYSKINSNLLVFASDMFTLSLPYILLIFDTNVKTDVFKRRNHSMQGTIVFVSNN